MNPRLRDRLETVQVLAENWMKTFDQPIVGGRCLFFAVAAQECLGAKVIAGSAQWQFKEDDGVSSTHFAYMFDTQLKEGDRRFQLVESELPEMHVWNFWNGKILDLSTKYLPEQLRLGLDEGWDRRFAVPPIYYGPWSDVRQRVNYIQNRRATEMAFGFINDLKRNGYGIQTKISDERGSRPSISRR